MMEEVPSELLSSNLPDMSIEYINARITREFCPDTFEKLIDIHLIGEYEGCPSVKQSVAQFGSIIEKYVDESTKQQILQEYALKLIPAGTKGVIRGNMLNRIVKQFILNLKLDPTRFDVCFEKQCVTHLVSEKPDWYILEKHTNRIIIGMNQLDLWGGGHQLNRGSKYILNNTHNTENSKLVCVVCNHIQLKTAKTKIYTLFQTGFRNNTLCYLNNLENIIIAYFNKKELLARTDTPTVIRED